MVVLYQKNSSSLKQIQRRSTIFILGKEYAEHERVSKLNLLTLQYRREIGDLIFLCNLDSLDLVSFRTCNKPLRKID